MNQSLEEIGVLTVVLEEFGKRTLPRILDIKKMIDGGGTLSDSDIDYLNEALNQAKLFGDSDETDIAFRKFFSRVAHLYNEVMTKALENEKSAFAGILQSTAEQASMQERSPTYS